MQGSSLGQLPPALLAVIGVLIVVQLSLQIWALVDLLRRKHVLGGRRWVWLLVILLGEIVGAVVYLAVGRNMPPEAHDPLASDEKRDAGRVEHAADVLYGKRDA